ncbi:uncharacterized protein RSE6_10519 [Rhynchosporium secalis]|uniref:Uncharacterized protein n=1 Tax=Rhynchosporium secalis TaxID=38038 RepID=A0A1E1MKL4_RHYSE|nr:uncharacterized protein RSE6_10519 [Rhynchosporium secalis]
MTMTMTMTMTTSPSTPQAQGRFPRSQGCGCIQKRLARQASSLTVYCTSSKRLLHRAALRGHRSRRLGFASDRERATVELARAGQPDIDVAKARLTIRHSCPALTGSLSQSAADVFHDPIYGKA